MYVKKIVLLLAITGASLIAGAQDKTQGIVQYEVTLFLHASLKPDQQQYKDMIPETATNQEVLYYNGNKAKVSRKQLDEINSEEGAKVKVQMGDNEKAYYIDGTTGKGYMLLETDGKRSLEVKEHTLDKNTPGTQTRTILGFTCREQIVKDKNGTTTLWVTDSLPFRGGPLHSYSAKGAVLGMESKKYKAFATAIEYVPVKQEEVAVPVLIQD